jgi:hypothetical protein
MVDGPGYFFPFKWILSFYCFRFPGHGGEMALAILGIPRLWAQRLTIQMCAIASGINAVFIFFFFPETQYFRTHSTDEPRNNVTSSSEKEISTVEDEKTMPLSETPSPQRKRSYLQELKPWSKINPNTNYLNLLLRPWPLIVYPALLYSFLAYASILGSGTGIINTNASIYQNAPYHMTPGINSLIKISTFIGVTLGAYFGGSLTDRYVAWRARRNNGIFEPETRLEGLIVPLFIVPAGLIMYSPSFGANL